MRIMIICIDTRGGIQPYAALGKGLQEAGHEIVFAVPKGFVGWLESLGLACHGLEGDVQGFVENADNAAAIEKGFLATHKLTMEKTKEIVKDWMRGGFAASEGADLILGGIGGMMAGKAIAEKRGVPFVQAHVQPLTSTTEYNGVLALPGMRADWGVFHQFSHWITRQAFWQPFRGGVNAARREVLGLPPAQFWGDAGVVRSSKDLILYGYSPSLLPRPKDWPANIRVTGYWFLDPEETWTPPAGLAKFLDAGPRPIVIGFGSMSSRDAEATTRLALEAAERSGQRVVLLSGWGGMTAKDLPDWAYPCESVPHSWLFPRTALAVHHGGAGTTGASLRAGIPTIIVPFTADQPYWARLVTQKRLGLSPGPRRKLTAEKLADAVKAALGNPEILDRSAEMGRRIRSENGVANAVEALNAAFASVAASR